MINKLGIKKQTVSAVIIRKDGTKEDLGIIAKIDNKKENVLRRLIKWLTQSSFTDLL